LKRKLSIRFLVTVTVSSIGWKKTLSARREQRNPRLREKNLQELRAGGGFTGRKKSGQTGNYLLTEEKLGGLKWREMG